MHTVVGDVCSCHGFQCLAELSRNRSGPTSGPCKDLSGDGFLEAEWREGLERELVLAIQECLTSYSLIEPADPMPSCPTLWLLAFTGAKGFIFPSVKCARGIHGSN